MPFYLNSFALSWRSRRKVVGGEAFSRPAGLKLAVATLKPQPGYNPTESRGQWSLIDLGKPGGLASTSTILLLLSASRCSLYVRPLPQVFVSPASVSPPLARGLA